MSSEIGKKLAEKFGTTMTPAQEEANRRQQRANLNLEIWNSIKTSLTEAANAYNAHSQGRHKLLPVDGGSRLMFNYGDGLTLSVIYGDLSLQLNPRQKSVNNVAQRIIVADTDEPYAFRYVNPNPTVSTPVFSKDQLVETTIKMALDQPTHI